VFSSLLKLKKNKLISFLCGVTLFIILSISAVSCRQTFVEIYRNPLSLISLTGREINGLIFFHRNLMVSQRLSGENAFLKQELRRMDELTSENRRLKDLLSLKDNSPYKVIAASVIARSPDNWGSMIIINKGKRNGVRQGMVVLNYSGLAGRVAEVGERASKVMLINDPNFSVSAMVQRSRQEGLACGALGDSLFMRYLPKDADIQAEDVIMTSGLTDIYPKGILIGTVKAVGDEFSGLTRYAVLQPAISISGIEEVLIIVQ
jgi:rod shape-determining protein MreC